MVCRFGRKSDAKPGYVIGYLTSMSSTHGAKAENGEGERWNSGVHCGAERGRDEGV